MNFLYSLFCLLVVACNAGGVDSNARSTTERACTLLKAHPSNLLVSFPGEAQYTEDISHASDYTTESSTCSVRPRTNEDVATIFEVLVQTRSPFAIKGRGHANNPAHSSTIGVQISLSLFKVLDVSPDTHHVRIGAGWAWNEVYEILEENHGIMAVGGRISGVGVSGFVLGGGYSYKSNRYGLASDTTVAYELVTPTGEMFNVTAENHADLFFGLQGGLNNFGVVTSITMEYHTQNPVFAGTLSFPGDEGQNLAAFDAAVARFDAEVRDPKAAMMGIHMYAQGQVTGIAPLFYDAPTAPAGIFEDFLALENATGRLETTSFTQFIKSAPSLPKNTRVLSHTVPLTHYPLKLVQEINRQTFKFGRKAEKEGSAILLATSVEPFQPSTFSRTKPGGSAYPHDASHGQAHSPFNMAIAWLNPADDARYVALMKELGLAIQEKAKSLGAYVEGALIYPNYAIADTKLEDMYGVEGVRKLRQIRKRWDPRDVMSLAGGFIVPFTEESGGRAEDEL